MSDATRPHIPVMLNEVLATVKPADGEVYVDATFGAGGYTTAILEAADCTVLAIDRDRTALACGAALKEKYGARLHLLHGPFGEAKALVRAAGYEQVDGIVADLGVSSMQIDQAQRGFSFRFDGPLDMRMDQDSGEETAADVVNSYDEKELANIIYHYGEERKSRHIAKAIIKARAESPIETTAQLADIVRGVVPRSPKDQSDPATRTFQALRIHVNHELEQVEQLLAASLPLLNEGGRLVVVSFHSLEDTLVKRFTQAHCGRVPSQSRHMPVADPSLSSQAAPAHFTLPSRKAIFPTDDESRDNPRSRSARLRVAIRTDEIWEEAA